MRLAEVRALVGILVGASISIAVEVETWCGKVYNAGTPEIVPTGWLREPSVAEPPLLDIQVAPRFSIYVGNEDIADFIVDATLSPYHGKLYNTAVPVSNATSDRLHFTIKIEGNSVISDTVIIDTTSNLFRFNLTNLVPRLEPYLVSLTGATDYSNGTYDASTELFYLPDKPMGSVVKVDALYGAVHYRNQATNGTFKPFFPFGFYGDYSGYFNISRNNSQIYQKYGYNSIIPETAFTDGNMTELLNELDEFNILFQYDMRSSFTNLTSVRHQVPDVMNHPSLLTWYTADEPDGWKYPFNSTTLVYELLASLDKYHPTALVLNCQNHWFQPYTKGADIILEDAYPVGISPDYSLRWNTTCNATYGDCGCDNCGGHLTDVSDRIDDFYTYGSWIGGKAVRKPVWAVNQAMSGQNYWSRSPTDRESWVMDILALNHGAKGRLAWIYPPTSELIVASSKLANVVTASPVVDFLVGANPSLVRNGKWNVVDVAYWALDGKNKILAGIVNPRNTSIDKPVEIEFPLSASISGIDTQPWGSVGWTLNGSHLIATQGLAGLETSLVVLS